MPTLALKHNMHTPVTEATSLLGNLPHSLAFGSGHYHFFEFTLRSMALSNICYASSFLSFPVSLSRALSLRGARDKPRSPLRLSRMKLLSSSTIPTNFCFCQSFPNFKKRCHQLKKVLLLILANCAAMRTECECSSKRIKFNNQSL